MLRAGTQFGRSENEIGRKSLGGFATVEQATAAVRRQLEMLHAGTETAHWSYHWWEPKDMDFVALTAAKYGEHVLWDSLSCKEQGEIIRDALKPSCTISPGGLYMKRWEVVMGFCLLLTAFLTPYDVAFVPTDMPTALWIIDRICDFVFLKDIVMQFFVAIQIENQSGVVKVRRHKTIAMLYFKSWFLLDIVSILPFDAFSKYVAGRNVALDKLKAIRLLRLFRLFKLARTRRASRLLSNWQSQIGIPTAKVHLLKICFSVILASHWIACLWGFCGSFLGSRLICRNTTPDDRWADYPHRSYYVDLPIHADPYDPEAFAGLTWLAAFAESRMKGTPTNPCDPPMLYALSLYWAVMTITSIGYGDILPVTPGEYVATCLLMLFGSLFWAYTIGNACSIISSMNPERVEFEQAMDDFNRMAVYQHLPHQLRIRGREYLREARAHQMVERHQTLMACLGQSLRGAIAQHLSSHYLEQVWYFRAANSLFRQDAAQAFVPHFFERREEVELFGCICVVEKGLVARRGRILVRWKFWGEDVIVRLPMLRLNLISVALTYAEVLALSRQGLLHIVQRHPDVQRKFKRAALLLALQSAFRIYAEDTALKTVSARCEWIHTLFGLQFTERKLSLDQQVDMVLHATLHGEDAESSETAVNSLECRLSQMQAQLDSFSRLLTSSSGPAHSII